MRYHFKLNENYGRITDKASGSLNVYTISSSTQNLNIVDAAAKHHLVTDYSFTKKGVIFLTSSIFSLHIYSEVWLVTS